MEKVSTTPFEDLILGSQFFPVLSEAKKKSEKQKAESVIGILQCCQCKSNFIDEQEALIHYKLHVFESHKSHFSIVADGVCPSAGCLFAGESRDALHFHCAHCEFAATEILDLPLHMEKSHLENYSKVSLILSGQTEQENKVLQCGECDKPIQGTVSTLLHFCLHDPDKLTNMSQNGDMNDSELLTSCNGTSGTKYDKSQSDMCLDLPPEVSKEACQTNGEEMPLCELKKDEDIAKTNATETATVIGNRLLLTNPQLASLQSKVLLPLLLNSLREKNGNDTNPLNLLASLMEAEQKNEFSIMPPQHFLLSSSPEIHKEDQDDNYFNSASPLPEGDPSPESLLNGFRDHYGDNYAEKSAGVFQCDQCSDAFKYQYLLATHRKQAHSVTVTKSSATSFPFQCHVCGNEFTALQDLKMHVWGHSTEYNSFCDTCGYAFTNLAQLGEHVKNHSKSTDNKDHTSKLSFSVERSNRCECCTVKFPSKAELTRHIVKYQGTCNPNKTGIKCATCSVVVESLEALKQHRVNEHPTAQGAAGKRGFECDYCGKMFSCRSNLRDHLVVHTGEKPYPCDICGKTFSFVHNMKTHRLTHNEGRNEMCPYCDRAYKSKISLYYHMKKGNCRGLSTKEVPEGFHRCTECLQMFASEERYYQHKAKGHCQISYRCEHCGVRCSTEAKLTRHLNKGGCLQSTSESGAQKKTNASPAPSRRSSRDNKGRNRRRNDGLEQGTICERCNYGRDCCCTFGCNYCGKRIFSFDAYNNHKRRVCPARRSKEKLKAALEKRRLRETEPVDVAEVKKIHLFIDKRDSVPAEPSLEQKVEVLPEEDSNSGSLTDLSNFTAPHLLGSVSSVQEA